MGMTIEKHIEVLSSYNHGFTGYAGNLQDSIDVAIDIMHKYQKIQEIYLKWNRNYDVPTSDAWTEIIGVIEDGKDN